MLQSVWRLNYSQYVQYVAGSSSSGAGTSGVSAKPVSSISIKRKAETASAESEKKVRTEAEVLKENGQ